MLKKVKPASAVRKKTRVSAKFSKKLKADKPKIASANKPGRAANTRLSTKAMGAKKQGRPLKRAVMSSAKTAPLAKQLGILGLQKQWAQAKKMWITHIRAELTQARLLLKQETTAWSAAELSLKKGSKQSPATLKSQKTLAARLQKRVNSAQKNCLQLTQLLLKAQAMNKVLSQFEKEWKKSAAVAKPKKTTTSAVGRKKRSTRRMQQMRDVVALSADFEKDVNSEAPSSETEAA